MIRSWLAPLSLIAAAAAGCAQGTDPPGALGYVLLDREARAAFSVSQDGWEGSPILPVALDVDLPVTLSGRDGATTLALRADTLAHVRRSGAEGDIAWLPLGDAVRDDRLIVHATGAAAAALAEALGGTSTARADGLWSVAAPDVFDRGSFLDPPEGVLEVLPDTRTEPSLGDVVPEGVAGASSLGGAVAAAGGGDGSVEAALVGVYVAGARSLVLDASGGFTLEDRCSGDVVAAGVFRLVDGWVMLQSDRAPALVLARDRDMLLDPGGAVFSPLLPPAEADPEDDGASAAGEPTSFSFRTWRY